MAATVVATAARTAAKTLCLQKRTPICATAPRFPQNNILTLGPDPKFTSSSSSCSPKTKTPPLVVYTDASLRAGRVGLGVLEARPDGRVRATHALLRGCLSRRVNESTHAELMAVLLALHLAATDRDGETWNQPIHILTDSVPALHHIRRGLAKNITPNIKYRAVITAIVASILARPQPTVCRHVKGHAGNHGNELADRLALIGRNIPAHDGTDADADDSPSYKHAGAITLRRTLLPGMHALTRTIHTDLNELMGASDWWDAGVATPK